MVQFRSSRPKQEGGSELQYTSSRSKRWCNSGRVDLNWKVDQRSSTRILECNVAAIQVEST